MQIVHYKEDSFFPFHRDVAEDTDFGTCIMQLNDGYQGGQLNVQGNLIAKDIGTITFFNNSTMWHGVEPYMKVNDLFYSYGLGEKNMADNREQVKDDQNCMGRFIRWTI